VIERTCEAGQRGIPCWHRAATRLRRVQEEARRQDRKLAQAPAVTMSAAAPRHQALRRVELV
jgi:hypothetical protein